MERLPLRRAGRAARHDAAVRRGRQEGRLGRALVRPGAGPSGAFPDPDRAGRQTRALAARHPRARRQHRHDDPPPGRHLRPAGHRCSTGGTLPDCRAQGSAGSWGSSLHGLRRDDCRLSRALRRDRRNEGADQSPRIGSRSPTKPSPARRNRRFSGSPPSSESPPIRTGHGPPHPSSPKAGRARAICWHGARPRRTRSPVSCGTSTSSHRTQGIPMSETWTLRRLTDSPEGTGGTAHSYYDIPVFDAAGTRIAAWRPPAAQRHPRADDPVGIGLVAADGEGPSNWQPVGTSRAWSWQQGPLAQWVGGRRLIWSDREGPEIVSRLHDPRDRHDRDPARAGLCRGTRWRDRAVARPDAARRAPARLRASWRTCTKRAGSRAPRRRGTVGRYANRRVDADPVAGAGGGISRRAPRTRRSSATAHGLELRTKAGSAWRLRRRPLLVQPRQDCAFGSPLHRQAALAADRWTMVRPSRGQPDLRHERQRPAACSRQAPRT